MGGISSTTTTVKLPRFFNRTGSQQFSRRIERAHRYRPQVTRPDKLAATATTSRTHTYRLAQQPRLPLDIAPPRGTVSQPALVPPPSSALDPALAWPPPALERVKPPRALPPPRVAVGTALAGPSRAGCRAARRQPPVPSWLAASIGHASAVGICAPAARARARRAACLSCRPCHPPLRLPAPLQARRCAPPSFFSALRTLGFITGAATMATAADR